MQSGTRRRSDPGTTIRLPVNILVIAEGGEHLRLGGSRLVKSGAVEFS